MKKLTKRNKKNNNKITYYGCGNYCAQCRQIDYQGGRYAEVCSY